jgi:hypothetical protein
MGGNEHCQYAEMSSYAKMGGAVGVIGIIPLPQNFAMVHFSMQPVVNYPPVVTWGNLGADLAPISEQLPMSIVLLQALFVGPVTVTLDSPVQAPIYTQFYTIPSVYSFIYWFTIFLCMLSCSVTSVKLVPFLERKMFTAISTVTLLICWFGSVWVMFISFEGFAVTVPGSGADFHTIGFFELWPYAFAASALVLLGFYFTEISYLTSVKAIPGLDKMKIPGFIGISLVWIVTLLAGFFSVYLRTNDIADTAGQEKYAVAVIFGLLGVFVLGVVAFGSISLFRTVTSNDMVKSEQIHRVLWFMILSIFAALNYVWGITFFSKTF